MPSFPTPDGIAVTANLPTGDLLVTASDRPDTVIGPDAADGLRATHADGKIIVDGPQDSGGLASWIGLGGSFEARIDLPVGSAVTAVLLEGGVRAIGRLGACTVRAEHGDITLEDAGPIRIDGGDGEVSIRRAHSDVDIKTDSGSVHLAALTRGQVRVSSDSGDIHIGVPDGVSVELDLKPDPTGDLPPSAAPGTPADLVVRASTRHGEITVKRYRLA